MDSVEDWLIYSGKCYDEHKNKLRANRLKEEISHLRDKPRITDVAKGLTRGGAPVEVRLSTPRKSPAPPPDPNEVYPFSPAINEDSKHKTSRYSSPMWKQKSNSHINNLRKQQQDLEVASLQNPMTNSNYSDSTKNRTHGLVLHDHLYKTDVKRGDRLFSKYEEIHHSQLQSKPRINTYKPSEKDTHIYQEYKQRKFAKKEAEEMAAREVKKTQKRSSSEPFFERFLTEHAEKKKTKKELEEEKALDIKRKATQKHISTYSEMLVKNSKQIKDHRQTLKPPPPNPDENEMRPAKVMTEAEIKKLHQRFHLYTSKKEATLSKIRSKRENEENRECTFNPFNAPAVQRSNTNEMMTSTRIRTGSLRDRNMRWLSRREERLTVMKRGLDNEEVEICTFRPYVNQEIPKNMVDTQTLHGYDEYVVRMRKSRMQREEEAIRKSNAFNTKKWTGRNTVPIEPRLGRSRRSSISSLNKPVDVPSHTIQQKSSDYQSIEDYNIALREYYASPEYASWWYSNQQYFTPAVPLKMNQPDMTGFHLEREVSEYGERQVSASGGSRRVSWSNHPHSNIRLERNVSEVQIPCSNQNTYTDPNQCFDSGDFPPPLPGGPGGGSSVRSDPVYEASDEVPNNYFPDSPYDDSLEPV